MLGRYKSVSLSESESSLQQPHAHSKVDFLHDSNELIVSFMCPGTSQ